MKNAGIKKIIPILVIVVLAVILLPVLVVNLTLIIRGNLNKDVPPDIFGIAPLAVVSPSMKGEGADSFDEGALIFIKVLNEEEIQSLKTGDVVCYRADGMYVTHRIIAENRDEADVMTSVITMGDANSVADKPVPVGDIFGVCVGSVAGLGSFAVFLQTPVGILVFVGIPVLLFIVYDGLRISLQKKNQRTEADEERREEQLRDKEEEIRRLQSLLDQRENERRDEPPQNGTCG